MDTQTILALVGGAILTPIIWWLMWRENFDGMRCIRPFGRELKSRDRLPPQEFYDQFYRSLGLREDIIFRLLQIYEDPWAVESALLRPHDDLPRIYQLDCVEFVGAIKSEFGVGIPDSDLESIDGSFDSIAKYLDARLKAAA